MVCVPPARPRRNPPPGAHRPRTPDAPRCARRGLASLRLTACGGGLASHRPTARNGGLASLCPTSMGGGLASHRPTARNGGLASLCPTAVGRRGSLRCARRGLASLRRGSLRFALRRWGAGLASLRPTAMCGVRWFVSRPPAPAVVLRRGLTAPGPPTRLAALGAGLLRCALRRVAGVSLRIALRRGTGARFALPYVDGRREMVCVPPARPRRSPPPGAHRPRTPDAPRCARRGLASLRLTACGGGLASHRPTARNGGLASLCPTSMGGVRWFVSRPPAPAGILRRGLTAPGPPTRLAALGAGLLRCAGARFASPYGGGAPGLASLRPTAMCGVRWFVSRPPTPAGVLRRGLTAPGPPTRLAALGAGLLRCAGACFASPYGGGAPGLASLRSARACFAAPGLASLYPFTSASLAAAPKAARWPLSSAT